LIRQVIGPGRLLGKIDQLAGGFLSVEHQTDHIVFPGGAVTVSSCTVRMVKGLGDGGRVYGH
jgi:hypothetical protein